MSLGPLQTIVDVGANVGQFALLALRHQPGAKVYSFEPQAEAANLFQAVIGDDPRSTLHRMALGAAEDDLPIHVTARADSSSLLVPALQSEVYPGTHAVATQKVHVMPLHQVLHKDDIAGPALLKIDVQGYEQQVLIGCEQRLHCFDWIFVEMSFIELYKGQSLAPSILAWLAGRGFELAGIYGHEDSYLNGRMVQGDFLFQRVVGTV